MKRRNLLTGAAATLAAAPLARPHAQKPVTIRWWYHFDDPKATPDAPRWLHVDVKLVRKTRLLSLAEMRATPMEPRKPAGVGWGWGRGMAGSGKEPHVG